MKFSLKTYLITLCLVGTVCGIMGKLLLEQPETFVSVLYNVATVGPFLLAIGTIVRLGLREPRRWKLVAWGGTLLVAPVVLVFGLAWLIPAGNPLRLLSTRRLIQLRLPTQIDQPWVWQELTYRVNSGSLTADEADHAVDCSIAHLKKNSPQGSSQPLVWQRDFLSAATAAKLISAEKLNELATAYYGPQPVVTPITPVIEGRRGIQMEVKYGSPFGPLAGFGVELLWDVKRVLLDEKPINVSQARRFVQNWNGSLNDPIDVGDHELQFEIECEFVDVADLKNMQSYQVPLRAISKARKRWTTTVKTPLKVVPKQ